MGPPPTTMPQPTAASVQSDAGDVLQALVERAVGALDLTAAAILVGDRGGPPQLAAATEERVRRLGGMELVRGEGPSVECWRTGEPVGVDLGSNESGRWAWFDHEARAAGFRSVHVVPMRHAGGTVGALSLWVGEGAVGRQEAAAAQAMADLAAVGLHHQWAAAEARSLGQQLQRALVSRVLIEQAKGMVAGRAGVDVAAAFHLVRAHARSHNLTLDEVCRRVLDGRLPVDALGARRPAGQGRSELGPGASGGEGNRRAR